jgi:regulator of nonsense transcripts 2
MQKKVKAANFDSRILLIFENAMIVSNPQPVIETRKQEKRRTPLDLYLRNLIYTTLRRDNAEKILHSIRSLPWSKRVEQTTEEINMADNTVPMSQSLGADSSKFVNVHKNVEKIFVKIWKVKFPLVETMASILAGLSKYHPSLVVDVIDSILEQVRFGMEDLTHFRHQQRRITTIHYVGQLCNYRIVPPLVIIDLLYLIIYFGHSYNDIPCPNEDPVCIIDPPAEFFRVRLVCELIQTCGVQFERSQLLPQFNRFMAIFLCYFLSKDSDSMIQEIDLMIKSTLSAFWAHKVPGTFEEAKAILYYIESGSLTSDSSANTVANAEKAITDEFVDDISSTSCSDDISSESESFSSESESENSESPSSLEISVSYFSLPNIYGLIRCSHRLRRPQMKRMPS